MMKKTGGRWISLDCPFKYSKGTRVGTDYFLRWPLIFFLPELIIFVAGAYENITGSAILQIVIVKKT